MKKYKVLWIDSFQGNVFVNLASSMGVTLVGVKSVEEGIAELEDERKLWDAVILQPKCLLKASDTIADLDNLAEGIKMIQKCWKEGTLEERIIPYFIYTENIERLEYISYIVTDREWDDRDFYMKPVANMGGDKVAGQNTAVTTKGRNDENQTIAIKNNDDTKTLIENIIKAADGSLISRLRNKYADVCDFSEGTQTFLLKDMLGILTVLDHNDFENAGVFNDIRKVLEWVKDYLIEAGVVPSISNLSLNDFKRCITYWKLEPYVPIYVQSYFYACIDVCNEGSHRLQIDEDVKSGRGRYLVKATIDGLLVILVWCQHLPQGHQADLMRQEFQRQYDYKRHR